MLVRRPSRAEPSGEPPTCAGAIVGARRRCAESLTADHSIGGARTKGKTPWISTSTRESSTSPASASRVAGGVADTVDEAVAQAEAAGYPVVVKAQVKVGGRARPAA